MPFFFHENKKYSCSFSPLSKRKNSFRNYRFFQIQISSIHYNSGLVNKILGALLLENKTGWHMKSLQPPLRYPTPDFSNFFPLSLSMSGWQRWHNAYNNTPWIDVYRWEDLSFYNTVCFSGTKHARSLN